MFKALHDAARKAAVIIRVAPEGDGLRVMIHQKADELKDGEIPLALTVVGTPEQLDAELPAALQQATGALHAAASIAEQVAKQTERAAAEHQATAKKPVKTKATANKSAAPKVKKAVPVHKKPAAAHKLKKNAAPKPVKHIASRPSAEDCINAYHAYAVANPGDIKREAFIKGNPTGRRFERLFGNWEKFIAATAKAGTINPPGDKLTKPLPLGTAAAAPARAGDATEAAPPAALPAAVTDGKGPVTGVGYSVYRNATGELVGGIVRSNPPAIGDIIELHDKSEWLVDNVQGNELRVSPWTPPADGKMPGLPDAWPFPQPAASIQVPAATVDPHDGLKGRSVIDHDSGEIIGEGILTTAETGAVITCAGQQLRVIDFDDKTIRVERTYEAAAAATQTTTGAPA